MKASKIWYDREGDLLEITFDDAAASLEEIENDVFERRTPEGRIVGFTVMNSSHYDRDSLALPFARTATASDGSYFSTSVAESGR